MLSICLALAKIILDSHNIPTEKSSCITVVKTIFNEPAFRIANPAYVGPAHIKFYPTPAVRGGFSPGKKILD